MIAALVVASLWLDAGAVASEPAPPSNPPASDASGADRAERAPPVADSSVISLVQRAAQQYDQGLLDDALATLGQAQQLSPDPSIVYNIAQIQRRRGDCTAALTAYKRYLEKAGPTDPKRDRATRWATEMQACVDRNVAAQGAPPPEPAPSPPQPWPPRLPGSTDRRSAPPPSLAPLPPSLPGSDVSGRLAYRRARIAGWSLVAAGGLCEVAAIVLQTMATKIQTDLNSEAIGDPRRNDQISSGHSYANWALGTAIAGGALVAGGSAVLIVNLQTDPTVPQSTVVGLAGTF